MPPRTIISTRRFLTASGIRAPGGIGPWGSPPGPTGPGSPFAGDRCQGRRPPDFPSSTFILTVLPLERRRTCAPCSGGSCRLSSRKSGQRPGYKVIR
ncbi:hypothetical protein Snoj_30750 [Streptomyces nojiriensis]|uniref:Uncharacterized protein n=1 Tax=Streptomyces nojiriensis TaxID=66374 RepID=A0ABQ3SM72_9ACTN|nr:hypothetical protein GCM10010205_52930 [Streptomyces nojiriensis]GHI69157.1 hypothetical protein Snoj_30750 [Streptomyces nojiriensis]